MIKAKITRPIPLERNEMARLTSWLNMRFGYHGWCHVPNERKCTPRQGAAMKRQGVKAGVPDVLIFARPNFCKDTHILRVSAVDLKKKRVTFSGIHSELDSVNSGIVKFTGSSIESSPISVGCAVELKREKGGRLSTDQQAWLAELQSKGWYTIIAYGYDDAVKQIEEVYGR